MLDIMDCVQIWRSEHVLGVLRIISQLFGDLDIPELELDLDEDLLDDTVNNSDWLDIRDDSSADLMSFIGRSSQVKTTVNWNCYQVSC